MAFAMASSFSLCLIFLLLASSELVFGCYESIISFGDSLADTGNLIRLSHSPSAVPPYGETFFHHPTGRFSDDRLVLNFIAEGIGFPLVPPYAGVVKNTSSRNSLKGVNFAVAGATALDTSFYKERGISNPSTNVCLGTELEWFKQMLPSLCNSPASCREFLGNSLVIMGEIGGNDYNHPFSQGNPVEEIQPFVPAVVATIGNAIDELIELGAQTVIVPGNLPIGCSVWYLTIFNNSRFMSTTEACCGVGGRYNFNSLTRCGSPSANVCDNPSSHVSWDGIHLTEAAYRLIANGLLQGPYTVPRMNALCSFGGSSQGILSDQ